MVKGSFLSKKSHPRGQSLVELALTLPIFLILLIGVMEIARVVFLYNAVFTASREAARYGASTGITSAGVPHFDDCAGMRERAKKTGILANLTDADITIRYDSGPDSNGNTVVKGNCPIAADSLALGDRIVVAVSTTYRPLIPVVQLGDLPIQSTTGRTLIKDLDVNWYPTPP